MHSAGAEIELGFYRTLQQLPLQDPRTKTAISFSRVFADLARRFLTAAAAQSGEALSLPPALALPALEAYAGQPETPFSQLFTTAAGRLNWTDSHTITLAAIAGWLEQHFDPFQPQNTSFQVWLNVENGADVEIYGKPTLTPPPAPLRLSTSHPLESWLQAHLEQPAALLAHYDTHGISMLALTLRWLRRLGISQVDCAMGFEWTGDIGKLWKRAVPKTLNHPNAYSTVIMVDCPIHSRRTEYTLKAVSRLNDPQKQRLVIVDHHPDTFNLAEELIQQPGVSLVLTDVFSCGLTAQWEAVELELMTLGGIADKVPEIASALGPQRFAELHEAAELFQAWCLEFSPTPPRLKESGDYPLRPLWEALAAGQPCTPQTAQQTLGEQPAAPPDPKPQYLRVGQAALVTERLSLAGRGWYRVLEQIMREAQVSYAIALRVLNDTRANFLLLTDWENTAIPPILAFVPREYLPGCLGHPTAVWVDMDIDLALPFLRAALANINAYFEVTATADAALEQVDKNILQAAPVLDAPPDAGGEMYYE